MIVRKGEIFDGPLSNNAVCDINKCFVTHFNPNQAPSLVHHLPFVQITDLHPITNSEGPGNRNRDTSKHFAQRGLSRQAKNNGKCPWNRGQGRNRLAINKLKDRQNTNDVNRSPHNPHQQAGSLNFMDFGEMALPNEIIHQTIDPERGR